MVQEYEYSGKAMGTDFSVSIVSNSKEVADTQGQYAEAEIRAYEQRFSRFLPQSELSLLNEHKSAIVSDIFLAALLESHRLFTQTRGIFNPLVQVERLGYTADFDTLHTDNEISTDDLYDIDFTATQINAATHHVTLLDGQKLDFGGFLKGYLAHALCVEIIESSPHITGVIVNIGGDIHTQGNDTDSTPFTFDIYNPITKTEISLSLHNESLATSGTYRRVWKHNNKLVHHILDASGTQNPDTDIVSASIIHTDGSVAEAYTKVFLSLGHEKALTILGDTSYKYLTITQDGTIHTNII